MAHGTKEQGESFHLLAEDEEATKHFRFYLLFQYDLYGSGGTYHALRKTVQI